MVRVVMLVTNAVNPDPRVEREAESLASRGITVRIVGTRDDSSRELPDALTDGVVIQRLPNNPAGLFSNRAGWVQAFFRLARYSLECFVRQTGLLRGTSVIHAHDFDTLLIGWLLSRISGAKLVYDAHEAYTGMFSSAVPRALTIVIDALEKSFSKGADLLLTTGYLMTRRMQAITGSVPITLRNAPPRSYGEEFLGRKSGRFLIGYVGGLLDDRNLAELMEAFTRFTDSTPESSLVIAGWGPLESYVRRQSLEKGRSIEFLGKIPKERVPELLASCSVAIVFTSTKKLNHYYASANKVFEAAASGTPVLATNFGELGATVRKYGLGFVTDSDDVDSIVASLRYVASRRSDLEMIGRRARDIFESQLCWERSEGLLVEAYVSLLRNKTRNATR